MIIHMQPPPPPPSECGDPQGCFRVFLPIVMRSPAPMIDPEINDEIFCTTVQPIVCEPFKAVNEFVFETNDEGLFNLYATQGRNFITIQGHQFMVSNTGTSNNLGIADDFDLMLIMFDHHLGAGWFWFLGLELIH